MNPIKPNLQKCWLAFLLLFFLPAIALSQTVVHKGWSKGPVIKSIWNLEYPYPGQTGVPYSSDIEYVIGSAYPDYTSVYDMQFTSLGFPPSLQSVNVEERDYSGFSIPVTGGNVNGVAIPAGSYVTLTEKRFIILTGSYAGYWWGKGTCVYQFGSLGTFSSTFHQAGTGSTVWTTRIEGDINGYADMWVAADGLHGTGYFSSINGSQGFGTCSILSNTAPPVTSTYHNGTQLMILTGGSATGNCTGVYTGPLTQTGFSLMLDEFENGGFFGSYNSAIDSGQSYSFFYLEDDAEAVVPDLFGMTQMEAETALSSKGFSVGTVTTASSCLQPVGRIISQEPMGGVTTSGSASVNLVISAGSSSSRHIAKGIMQGAINGNFQTDYESPLLIGATNISRQEHVLGAIDPAYLTRLDWTSDSYSPVWTGKATVVKASIQNTFDISGTVYTAAQPAGIPLPSTGSGNFIAYMIQTGPYAGYWWMTGTCQIGSYTVDLYGIGTSPDPNPSNVTWFAVDGDIHGSYLVNGNGVGSQGTLNITSFLGEQAYGTVTDIRTSETKMILGTYTDMDVFAGNIYFSGDCSGAYAGAFSYDTLNIYIPALACGFTIGDYSSSLGNGEQRVLYFDCGTPLPTPPVAPTLLSPANTASGVSLTPLLHTGPFSDPGLGDIHARTEWQLSTAADCASGIVLDITSMSQLTSLTVSEAVLEPGTTYYWRARFYDNYNNESDWSAIFSFQTTPATSDNNGDGIPDGQAPPTGDPIDMNDNGTPDNQETTAIKTLYTAVGGGSIGIEPAGGCTTIESIESVRSINPATHVPPPPATMGPFPLGIVACKINVFNEGDEADVVAYYTGTAPPGFKLYKYDAIDGWHDYSAHATFMTGTPYNYVIVRVKDGGFGDADGIANRTIVDPFGIGLGGAVSIEAMEYPECISELSTASISVDAIDPHEGELSYVWQAMNGGTITGNGATVTFDPPDSGPHPCPYRVQVTVTSSLSGLSTKGIAAIYVKRAGDVNGDGVVNIVDKVLVRNAFGQGGDPGWIPADVNRDGVVNIIDKVIVRNQFGLSGCVCPYGD